MTNKFVKIFDLSKDNIAPQFYFTLAKLGSGSSVPMDTEESIKDITFAPPSTSNDSTTLFAIGENGAVYVKNFDPNNASGEQTMIKTVIPMPPTLVGVNGSTIYFASASQLLCVSYADSKALAARLDQTRTAVLRAFSLTAKADVDNKPSPHANWIELPEQKYIISIPKKNATFISLNIKKDEITLQNIKPATKAASKVEGIAAISRSGNKVSLFVLMEEGSLFRYDTIVPAAPAPTPQKVAPTTAADILSLIKKKKERGLIPNGKPVFPITYFEKITPITTTVQLGGDILQHYTSDSAKANLASNNDYIISPKKEGFKIVITNPNHASSVMVILMYYHLR